MNDPISRQAAIDAIAKDIMGGLNYENILKELPTADVRENVRGEWIENKKTKQDYQLLFYKVLTCSQCGKQQIKLKGSNFCPNCGADMRGDKT